MLSDVSKMIGGETALQVGRRLLQRSSVLLIWSDSAETGAL